MCDAAAGLRSRGHEAALLSRPGSILDERRRALGIPGDAVEMRGDVDPAAIISVARWISSFRPRVVCANLDREIRIAAAAIRLAAVGQLLFGRREQRPLLVPRRGSEFPLKNKLHYRLLYTRFVDRVIVNSNATRDTMISTVPWFDRSKAIVVYNGIDFSPYDALEPKREESRKKLRREAGVEANAPVVVLVGELTERKGHRFLIDAAPAVLRRRPDTLFLLVGEGDARAEIEESIRTNGLEKSFRLTGFRDDVPEILMGSDVAVLPSTVEGFGYVLVEAMAASLPVVASRASSIPEIVEEGVTGYLHEPGDSAGLARYISMLLEDEIARREMGERGKRRARRHFSLDSMLDRLESVFFPM